MRRKISVYNVVDVSVGCQVSHRMLPCAGYGLQYSGFDFMSLPQPCSACLLVLMSPRWENAGSGSVVTPWSWPSDWEDLRGREAGAAPSGPPCGDGIPVVRGDSKSFPGA